MSRVKRRSHRRTFCSLLPCDAIVRRLSPHAALSQSALLALLSPEARAALGAHQQAVARRDRDERLDEDFGMSQFWYTSLFSRLLAHEALTLGGSRQPEQPVTLVCIACPSIFQQLYAHRSATTRVWLLEYDARFARYEPFFVHYDLHQPLHNLPAQLVHAADCLIVDPPYINIDTLSLAMQTAHHLARPAARLIVNTGAVLRERIERLWDMRVVRERPAHRVQIMNPFLCYTNYDAKQLGGWERDDDELHSSAEVESSGNS